MHERVHNSPNLIYAVGTQVVTRTPAQSSSGRVVHFQKYRAARARSTICSFGFS